MYINWRGGTLADNFYGVRAWEAGPEGSAVVDHNFINKGKAAYVIVTDNQEQWLLEEPERHNVARAAGEQGCHGWPPWLSR